MVQWLRLHTSTAGDTVLNSGWEIKIPHAVCGEGGEGGDSDSRIYKELLQSDIKTGNTPLRKKKKNSIYQISNFCKAQLFPTTLPNKKQWGYDSELLDGTF